MSRSRFAAAGLLGLLLAATPVFAKSIDSTLREAEQAGQAAVTVFVDAHFGARKDGAARQLSDAHAAAARHGYQLVDVETYTENGDLVGFFVSHRRVGTP